MKLWILLFFYFLVDCNEMFLMDYNENVVMVIFHYEYDYDAPRKHYNSLLISR